MDTISCIVPVYNEEERIGGVLTTLTQCNFLHEIIVVDDFSVDNSFHVSSRFQGVTVIKHDQNHGKSMAINTGIERSTGSILLFIDADLIGLTVQAIKDLIEPIAKDTADMTISLRKNTPGLWRWIGLDYISGERCFRKSLLSDKLHHLPSLDGFQLEVFLNDLIIEKGLRLAVVWWPNVISPLKRKRMGVYMDFVVIGMKILSYLSPIKIFRQIWYMKKLIVP